MTDNGSSFNKVYFPLLLSVSALLVFLALFIFRAVDDNRLTSWNWAFHVVDVNVVFIVLVPGLIAAHVLSKISLPESRAPLYLFILSFIICIPFWKEPEVILDASRYFTQAKHLKEYGIKYFLTEWGRTVHAWTDLPLIPFLYGLTFKYFGESRISVQVLATSFFSLTVICTYLTGKELWDENLGFHAALMLLGIPYLFTQVPLMLVDIATMSFLIFSVFTFVKALKRGGMWIPVSSMAMFLAVFSKYSTWMMLSVLGITILVFLMKPSEPRTYPVSGHQIPASRIRIQYFRRALMTSLLAIFFIGVVIYLKFDVISEQINLLLSYQKPALKGWSESFVSTFFYQIHPFITLAAIYSFYAAIRKRDLKYLIICWLAVLILFLSIKRIRYILPSFPMFTLMAAYGLQEIKNKELQRFTVLTAVISSMVISLFIYLPFLQKMSSANIMQAGRYLNTIEAQEVEVITLPPRSFTINPAVAVPVLDLFTDKDIHYNYVEISPPDIVKTLPLRFTWDYKNPDYYANNRHGEKKGPVVIITTEHEENIPGHIQDRIARYRKIAEFRETSGFFRFSPDVIVYQP
jgi:hypothetical protein